MNHFTIYVLGKGVWFKEGTAQVFPTRSLTPFLFEYLQGLAVVSSKNWAGAHWTDTRRVLFLLRKSEQKVEVASCSETFPGPDLSSGMRLMPSDKCSGRQAWCAVRHEALYSANLFCSLSLPKRPIKNWRCSRHGRLRLLSWHWNHLHADWKSRGCFRRGDRYCVYEVPVL